MGAGLATDIAVFRSSEQPLIPINTLGVHGVITKEIGLFRRRHKNIMLGCQLIMQGTGGALHGADNKETRQSWRHG